MALRILIASPIRLNREGLAQLLAPQSDIEVIGTVSTGGDWIADRTGMDPDLILVDLAPCGGLDLLGALRARTSARLLALFVAQDERTVYACARASVTAFVSRDATVDVLVASIRRATTGESVGPAWLMPMLLRCIARDALGNDTAPSAPVERLTRREQEVLALIAEGLANKEIARRLRIELPTVKNHVHNILEKSNLPRRSAIGGRLEQMQSHPSPQLSGACR